jgi:hypothetical protein
MPYRYRPRQTGATRKLLWIAFNQFLAWQEMYRHLYRNASEIFIEDSSAYASDKKFPCERHPIKGFIVLLHLKSIAY